MRDFSLDVLCIILSLPLIAGVSSAQAASPTAVIGTPPFSSIGGGPFDVINLANLNVHLTVPIRHKAGRGVPFMYDLQYDSSLWNAIEVNGQQAWTPYLGYWGWQGLISPIGGNLNYTTKYTFGNCGQSGQYTWQSWEFDNLSYDDVSGSHPFTTPPFAWVQTNGPAGQCPPNGPQPSSIDTIVANDGSGVTLHAIPTGSSSLSWSVTNSAGLAYVPGGGVTAPTDANGNFISFNGSAYTDTLNQTALTLGGGVPPTPTTFSYTAPSGGTATYTVSYAGYTIKTNFNCSGIADYNSTGTVYLVDTIQLPDSSKYKFTYEQTAGGTSGQTTGRLQQVTLPTGGSIQYTYPLHTVGSNTYNTINCSDGSAPLPVGSTPSLTRVVMPGSPNPSGTWTYSRNYVSGNHWQTTVTDPTTAQNQTLIDFQQDVTGSFFETQRVNYGGLITAGNVLSTTINCYNITNATISSCPTNQTVGSPITEVTTFSGLPDTSGTSRISETDTQYSYVADPGFPTEIDSYDYGLGGPGGILRKVITAYHSFGNTIRPTSIQVTDGSTPANVFSQMTLSYDQGTLQTSGAPQHNSVTGGRGNLTTIQKQVNGRSSLYQVLSYYDTGTPYQSTDNGNTSSGGSNITTFTYGSGSCGDAFVTSISEPLGLTQSATWDCNGGVQTSSTDENGAISSTFYTGTTCAQNGAGADPDYWRPFATKDALGNCITMKYPSLNIAESTLAFNSNNSVVDNRMTTDGFGRLMLNQAEQGYNSANYDTTFTEYNNIGSPYFTTLPYQGTAGQVNSSAPSVNNQYDPLGRLQSTAYVPGGGSVAYTYKYNDTYQDVGPAPSPENDKRKQLEYDGLGRLLSVCEVTSAGPGVCGQSNNAYNGYWTLYTYDPLGDMTGVNENSAGTNQTRAFAFDMLGRMTQEVNPESGTTTYTYDSVGANACYSSGGSSPGDLLQVNDANGNYTCYVYDALHRITDVGHSGPNSTSCKRFRYDNSNGVLGSKPSGVTVNNGLGRIAEAETDTCAWPITSSSVITDEWFSYTARGELTDFWESTPHSGRYYHTSTAYWANGALQTLSGVGQQSAYSFGVDGEGRLSTAIQGTTNYVTGTTYNNASQPLTVSLKTSGDSDSYVYDASTGRMTKYTFTINGKSMVGQLNWNTNWSLGSLAITDGFNASGTQTCNYGNSTTAGYDDLGRLLNVNCGSLWSQTFSYNDAFGNITKSGSSSWMPGYNSKNQYTLSGVTYDNNGDLTKDTFHTYTWDAEGNPITIDSTTCGSNGTCLTFDASDRVVENNVAGTITEIEYSPIGKVAVMSGATQKQAYVPLPGGEELSPGPDTYWHTDWLGTVRLATGVSARTVTFDRAFGPFGEMYDTVTGGSSNPNYTGDTQDTVSGEFDTPFRELHPGQSRWISPDPAGLAAVDPTNPQTWNQYAYAGNSPLNALDPSGLCTYVNYQIETDTQYDSNGNVIQTSKSIQITSVSNTPGPCPGAPPPGCYLLQEYGGTIGGVACGAQPAMPNSSSGSGTAGNTATISAYHPSVVQCLAEAGIKAAEDLWGPPLMPTPDPEDWQWRSGAGFLNFGFVYTGSEDSLFGASDALGGLENAAKAVGQNRGAQSWIRQTLRNMGEKISMRAVSKDAGKLGKAAGALNKANAARDAIDEFNKCRG